jgi:hypothetical protein
MWIVEWFMETTFRWGDPAEDDGLQQIIHTHLQEAVECLT